MEKVHSMRCESDVGVVLVSNSCSAAEAAAMGRHTHVIQTMHLALAAEGALRPVRAVAEAATLYKAEREREQSWAEREETVSGSVVASVSARGLERVIVRDGAFSSASRHTSLRAALDRFCVVPIFVNFFFVFSCWK